MALALRSAAPLKAQVRLAQAVSEFEASLNAEHKAAFRNARIATKASPPTPSDVMRLTAEIDSRVRQEHGPSRCFGPRLTNMLQAVQQFAALGDTVVGGSQNLVACGVWSAVRMMLHIAIGYASYLEKLSLLFMTAGRQAPRYEALAIIYPRSKTLQRFLCEYFIVIVRICQKIQKFAMKSAFGQFKSSLGDADLKEFQADLDLWGNAIKNEAAVLLNERIHDESQENQKARALVSKWSTSSARQEALERKMRWLDACSTYDFQTTWKQIRKRGSTSLLPMWVEYQLWKQKSETPAAILLSGKIGAGKSVTLANIVDDLHLSGDTMTIYFFCRHDIPESLKSRTIIGSLARQYLSQFPEYIDPFKEDVPTLDLDEVTALMKPQHDNRPRYLLIDGLDECSIEEQRSVLTQISWLQRLSNWRLGFSARLSAQNVVERFVNLKWHISLPTSNPDIERYIDSELKARIANGQLKLRDPGIESEIRAALLGGANGMFLWVALQLDQICSEVSDHSIRLAIKSLPRDLSEIYARILRNSAHRDNRLYHVRLLKFLAAAYMPLTIDQIQEMASVTIGDITWDSSKCINDILTVIGFCGSLVMIEEEEQTLRFAHHSGRSFCQGDLDGFDHWKFCFSDEEAHRELGETAVTYLNYGIFDTRLSTKVIPEVDVGGAAGHIIQHTLGTSRPIQRLALGLIRPRLKQHSKRDIGQFLERSQKEGTTRGSETISHPFLSYAKEFWLLHTRDVEGSAVQKLWERLFDEVDIHHIQLTPHILGPLDAFQIPCKYPLASAFLWAINYSHLSVFERLMNPRGNGHHSTKLPWARFRFFRCLLQHLQPRDSLDKGPYLKARMLQRLFPLAITLRVYHAVEMMLPFVDIDDTVRGFRTAVSCGNYKSAAFISSSPIFKLPDRPAIPPDLFSVAAASRNAQMICLLANMQSSRSAETDALVLSSVLYSDVHHSALLRALFVLARTGIRATFLDMRDISAIFQLLAASPELNKEMASQAITQVLAANSNLPELHQHTFRQACSIGSFGLAYITWLSYFNCKAPQHDVGKISRFPFKGDELALVLQRTSRSGMRLANWIVEKGATCDDQQAFRRAIMLRNWQLADALLTQKNLLTETLAFCTHHELLHICVVGGDLIGIDFLLRIGMDFEASSNGPMFGHETPNQALVSKESDYFVHHSIAELVRRGVCIQGPTSPGFAVLGGVMGRLILPDISSTWDPQIRQVVRQELRGGICSNDYSWFICFVAAIVRKIAETQFVPLNGDVATGLRQLKNWSELLEEIIRSPLGSPACGLKEGIIVIRETFGATAIMDKSITANDSPLKFSSKYRLQALQGVWGIFDLFFSRQSQDPVSELSRGRAIQELAFLLCKRSLEDAIFPACSPGSSNSQDPLDPSILGERVYEALCLAGKGQDLSWMIQTLVSRSDKFSHFFSCSLRPRDFETSDDIMRAFGLMEQRKNSEANVQDRRPPPRKRVNVEMFELKDSFTSRRR